MTESLSVEGSQCGVSNPVRTHGTILLLEGLLKSSGLLVDVLDVGLDLGNVGSDEHGECQDGNEGSGEELHFVERK